MNLKIPTVEAGTCFPGLPRSCTEKVALHLRNTSKNKFIKKIHKIKSISMSSGEDKKIHSLRNTGVLLSLRSHAWRWLSILCQSKQPFHNQQLRPKNVLLMSCPKVSKQNALYMNGTKVCGLWPLPMSQTDAVLQSMQGT